jgi:DNA polymerase III epsilon subunit-like protein
MMHLIMDTESTGLPKNWKAPLSDSNNWPRLVQLSWIMSNGLDRQEFNFIIKPNGFIIPAEASAIHGISQEQAEREGVDLAFALAIFRACVNVADKIVAHNISFDRAIVGAEYYRMGLGQSFEKRLEDKELFCTMLKSTELVGITGAHAGQKKWPKLIELYQHLFKETFDGAHNSLMDTRACERCYFSLIKR